MVSLRRIGGVYLPCLGASEAESATGWVVLGTCLHAAGVTAMVRFSQAKATKDLTPSCQRKTKPLNMHAVKALWTWNLLSLYLARHNIVQ